MKLTAQDEAELRAWFDGWLNTVPPFSPELEHHRPIAEHLAWLSLVALVSDAKAAHFKKARQDRLTPAKRRSGAAIKTAGAEAVP